MTAATQPVNLAPPRGMRDFYPDEARIQRALFDAWSRAAHAYGFDPYDACVVESLDLLKRKAGEEITEQIYAFKDKSGRDLALRPEMTPTLARMVAARQGSLSFPIKWTTIAQCFRYERTTRGRKREHYQWNLDIIGEPNLSAEVDVLGAAIQALDLLDITRTQYRVRFSSRRLLAELMEQCEIPPHCHAAAFLALDKREKLPEGAVADFLQDAGLTQEHTRRILHLLAMQSIEEIRAVLPPTSPALQAVDKFLLLAAAAGIDEVLCFDLSVIRGLSYYTGIVFEAFDCDRKFRAIFGGGRYDNLLGDVGGQPATGVGLGFGDVVIRELLPSNSQSGPILDVAIGYMDCAQQTAALRLAHMLRQQGYSVDVALSPEKPKRFFARAGSGRFQKAALLGPDDLAAGCAKMKNMATRAEESIAIP